MTYFKINNNDYSMYVSTLKIGSTANYIAQQNAAGNTVVDYINAKRTIEVGIIPVKSEDMIKLQNDIQNFNVSLSFLNPTTNTLEENVSCIIPTNAVDYYTVRAEGTTFKAFTLQFTEL